MNFLYIDCIWIVFKLVGQVVVLVRLHIRQTSRLVIRLHASVGQVATHRARRLEWVVRSTHAPSPYQTCVVLCARGVAQAVIPLPWILYGIELLWPL